jgi:hypothetical protein
MVGNQKVEKERSRKIERKMTILTVLGEVGSQLKVLLTNRRTGLTHGLPA